MVSVFESQDLGHSFFFTEQQHKTLNTDRPRFVPEGSRRSVYSPSVSHQSDIGEVQRQRVVKCALNRARVYFTLVTAGLWKRRRQYVLCPFGCFTCFSQEFQRLKGDGLIPEERKQGS